MEAATMDHEASNIVPWTTEDKNSVLYGKKNSDQVFGGVSIKL